MQEDEVVGKVWKVWRLIQKTTITFDEANAELSFELQRLLQPIQKKVDNFHCTPRT